MKKKFILILSFAFLLGVGAFFFSKSSTHEKPEILVTLAPYQTFASKLLNDEVRVHALVPEREDPHIFSPSTKELMTFFSAKVWFLTGEPFEEHIKPILLKHNPKLKIVDLKEGIDLLEGGCCLGHHHQDLHFWMSPSIAQTQVQQMAKVLKETYPQKKDVIEQQSNYLEVEFQRLKSKLRKDLSEKKGTSFLVSHPAFSYFAHEFELNQVSIEDGGADPSPKKLAYILSLIDQEHIQTLYIQPQQPEQVIDQIASVKHLKKIEMNPYDHDYFESLSQFGDQLKGNADGQI